MDSGEQSLLGPANESGERNPAFLVSRGEDLDDRDELMRL
jgi:hypothetical protein